MPECRECVKKDRQLRIAREQMKYHHNDGFDRGRRAGLEVAAEIVNQFGYGSDRCSRMCCAHSAYERIRALKDNPNA